jgi:hypothetical protein
LEATPRDHAPLVASVPSLAIVAEVPMHWSCSGEALAHAAHEEGDVGALAPAVGVQLVEHEEAQPRAVADHLAIELVLPGHQQLEHHEVGEQDVGRVSAIAPRSSVSPGRCSARR